MIELTYSTSRALIARSYWRSLRRNRKHQLLWLAYAGVAFMLGAQGSSHPLRTGLLCSIGVIAALALAPQVLFKPQTRVLRVHPDGLETAIGTKAGKVGWRDIAQIERQDDYVIVTGRNLNAFIVPVAAFPDARACNEAIAQWRAWLASSSRTAT